jgi:hypothetical protein
MTGRLPNFLVQHVAEERAWSALRRLKLAAAFLAGKEAPTSLQLSTPSKNKGATFGERKTLNGRSIATPREHVMARSVLKLTAGLS